MFADPSPVFIYCLDKGYTVLFAILKKFGKNLVDFDNRAFLIDFLPIFWQFFLFSVIISARDMATWYANFGNPENQISYLQVFLTSLARILGPNLFSGMQLFENGKFSSIMTTLQAVH